MGDPLKCVQCQSWMHPACFSQLAANRLKRKRKFDDEDLGRTVFDHRMKRFVCPFCVVEKKVNNWLIHCSQLSKKFVAINFFLLVFFAICRGH